MTTPVSTGGTSADPAVTADVGISYQFNDPWSWRSALQYIYIPHSNFKTQENISGYILAPQPLVQGTAVLTTDSNAVFWNNMLQRQLCHNVSLYAQGGIGFSQNQTSGYQTFFFPSGPELTQFSDGNFAGTTSNQFAWNAGVGVWLNANENVGIDISYTYDAFGKIASGGGLLGSPAEFISANLNRNMFLIGAQYKFDVVVSFS